MKIVMLRDENTADGRFLEGEAVDVSASVANELLALNLAKPVEELEEVEEEVEADVEEEAIEDEKPVKKIVKKTVKQTVKRPRKK